MDAHFNEYLAAVAGMRDVYGEAGDGHSTDFHDDTVPGFDAVVEAETAAGSIWDV